MNLISKSVRTGEEPHIHSGSSQSQFLVLISFQQHEPTRNIVVLIMFLSNEKSGQPAQMCRLARAFAACLHKVWIGIKVAQW